MSHNYNIIIINFRRSQLLGLQSHLHGQNKVVGPEITGLRRRRKQHSGSCTTHPQPDKHNILLFTCFRHTARTDTILYYVRGTVAKVLENCRPLYTHILYIFYTHSGTVYLPVPGEFATATVMYHYYMSVRLFRDEGPIRSRWRPCAHPQDQFV